MAKQTGLTGVTKLGAKKTIPKKTPSLATKVDKIAKDIQENKPVIPKQKNVRVTIDIPESEYLEMKMKLVGERRTVRDYFLSLLRNDITK